ncbi:MAG TPA: exonuclease domain-containing protein [Telluria sp.]
MTPARSAILRFAAALALLFTLQLALLAVFLLFLSLDAQPAQRALLGQLLAQNAVMLAVLALVLLLLLGIGLKSATAIWLAPLDRIAEEAELLASNPRHRIAPLGGRGMQALVARFNQLAAANEALREQGRAQLDAARHSLADERNRLAALMSDLTLGVLLCNAEGRILLYNQRARELLGASHRIGLGRPVYGVLARGQVEHALDQVRHQLYTNAPGHSEPVAGFVAVLPGGQSMRVQMAPVLDDERVLDGFVLTLEDFTREIEAETRRDHLLQSLGRNMRSAVGNLRSAVETAQGFPTLHPEMQARLALVIDQESQRLARDIDWVDQLAIDAHDARRELEAIHAGDLLALLQRGLDVAPLRVTADGPADPGLWLKVDSYALSRVLAGLAQRLAADAGVRELHLAMQRTGRLACLALSWPGSQPPVQTLRHWEEELAPSGAGEHPFTLKQVVARHGGETACRNGPVESSFALLLPIVETRIALAAPRSGEGITQFFDFDLFHQKGQTEELDQQPLSQLAYTVFDTETTGLQPSEGDEIIAIGALRIVNGRLLQRESFERLVQAGRAPSAASEAIHGIAADMLEGQPRIGQVLREFQHFSEDTVLIAHNAAFDMRFLQMQERLTGVAFTQPVLDTLLLSQVIHPHQPQHTLEAIAGRLGVEVAGRHTALGDAAVTGAVFLAMLPLLAGKGIVTLGQARAASKQTMYARLRY